MKETATEQILFRLRDALRLYAFEADTCNALILLLMGVARRARPSTAPGLDQSGMQLASTMEQLARDNPVLNGAFINNSLLKRLNPAALPMLVDLASQVTNAVLGEDASLEPAAIPALLGMQFAVDPSLSRLMSALLAPEPGREVYVGWDSLGQLGAALRQDDAQVFLEMPSPPLVATLLGEFYRSGWRVEQANPLFSESSDLLQKPILFRSSAAILPFGAKIDPKMLDGMSSSRFPERTSSMVVLGIRHLLAVTTGRIVVAVQNNLLFSAGAEYSLRADLLRRGMLKTVIALPSGLLYGTSLACSVLVIEPQGNNDSVRFIDADSPRYKTSMSRTRATLHKIGDLVRMSDGELEGPDTVTISTRMLLDNVAQLQVNRYVLPEKVAQVRALLAAAKTVALEDAVTLVRSPLTSSDRDTDDAEAEYASSTPPVFEVGVADLPEFGYIKQASRRVTLDSRARADGSFLRPLDIVLIIKGSIGKVGIVPDDQTFPADAAWITGQAAIVLRVRESALIDPRALFVQLRSPLGQELLKGIVSGAAIPLIQLKELRTLAVIVPEPHIEHQAIRALESEADLERQVSELRTLQAAEAARLWQLT